MRYTTLNMKMEFPVLLDDVEVCKMVIKDIEEKAKLALKEDPKAIPGWTLKPGAGRRSIGDIVGLAQRVVSDKFPVNALMKCCRVKIGTLEKEFAASVGVNGKKEVGKLFFAKVGDLVTTKLPEPSLVRVTAEEAEEVEEPTE